MEVMCLANVKGNRPGKRIGVVKFHEPGYYVQTFDRTDWTEEAVSQFVSDYNLNVFGISDEVAESAKAGSMFGWHVPAAKLARDFYDERVRHNHANVRITIPAQRTQFTWCQICKDWFKPLM